MEDKGFIFNYDHTTKFTFVLNEILCKRQNKSEQNDWNLFFITFLFFPNGYKPFWKRIKCFLPAFPQLPTIIQKVFLPGQLKNIIGKG